MVRCPECASSDTTKEDWEEDNRNEDEFTIVIHEYWICQDCKCEFKVTIRTETSVEVEEHGNQLFQSQ